MSLMCTLEIFKSRSFIPADFYASSSKPSQNWILQFRCVRSIYLFPLVIRLFYENQLQLGHLFFFSFLSIRDVAPLCGFWSVRAQPKNKTRFNDGTLSPPCLTLTINNDGPHGGLDGGAVQEKRNKSNGGLTSVARADKIRYPLLGEIYEWLQIQRVMVGENGPTSKQPLCAPFKLQPRVFPSGETRVSG